MRQEDTARTRNVQIWATRRLVKRQPARGFHRHPYSLFTRHSAQRACLDHRSGDGDLHNISFVDFTNGMKEGGPYDDYGHGTHVAGLIASTGDVSHSQYAGLAPDAHLVVLKVLDKNDSGYTRVTERQVDHTEVKSVFIRDREVDGGDDVAERDHERGTGHAPNGQSRR